MTMHVRLSHVPNPDIREGGYWSQMCREGETTIRVKSLVEATAVCGRYITKNDLGGGNWTGGQVFDDTCKQIARVSYNGRVWDNEGTEIVL